jgi:hypothetical protein
MSNNDQIIYDVAIKNGFNPQAAKLIVAQARFESSDYTSNVFKNNINTSGMKYVGQPLATRGTLAPFKERSKTCQEGGVCKDSDHYAKFKSVEDSAKDKIERNFLKIMRGVTPEQLKSVTDANQFADLLKQRGYYGFGTYGTPEAQKEINNYAGGLKAKLLKINVIEFIRKNPKSSAVGILLILGLLSYYGYYLYKKSK